MIRTMETVQYQPTMLKEVTDLYNDVVQGVPHCWPVTPEVFASGLAPATECPLDDETQFVVLDGGKVRAFVHVGMRVPEGPYSQPEGAVRFLAFRRGDHRAGNAAIAHAVSYFAERSIAPSTAFYSNNRYPFYYMPSACLSDDLDHIGAALGIAGYSRDGGEVFLDWPEFDPLPVNSRAPVSSAEVHEEETAEGGALPGLKLQLMHKGIEIAKCFHESVGNHSQSEEAQQWAFCTSLHVRREYQGSGVGKWLLMRALGRVKDLGYRHASISTAAENWRAQALYGNVGYHAVDWTYGWRRPGHEF
jgi:GNAT superfamily N-acetyltransferase